MSQAEMFSRVVSVDDLEDCTCPLGIVFGGDYWDAPPTTTPEGCDAHRNEVNQRRPTRESLNFAMDMERRRLARPPALPDFVAPPAGHVDMTSHNEVGARIDAGARRAKYGDKPVFPSEWDELRPKCKCCEWPDDPGSLDDATRSRGKGRGR